MTSGSPGVRPGETVHACATLRGENVGLMTRNSVTARGAAAKLGSMAATQGWKRVDKKWACPWCWERRKQ